MILRHIVMYVDSTAMARCNDKGPLLAQGPI
jgi:hypothetical protein